MIVVGCRLVLRPIAAQLVDRSSISATAISSRSGRDRQWCTWHASVSSGRCRCAPVIMTGTVHRLLELAVLHLSQVLSLGTGLLARAALGRSTFCPAGSGWLLQSFFRRRHRRVARIATETLLEIGETGFKLGNACRLLLGQQLKRSDLILQLLVGDLVRERRAIVGRNSQRYARLIPRWRMVRSGDLNTYYSVCCHVADVSPR